MNNDDPKREAGALIAKHGFGGVESTRHMAVGSLDPGLLRTRMEERGGEDDDSTVAAIISRVKKQHEAMEDASLMFDAEMDGPDNSLN